MLGSSDKRVRSKAISKGHFRRYSKDNKPLLRFERIDFSQVEHRGKDDFLRLPASN